MPQYRVLPGKSFGVHKAGEIVEENERDAAPYLGTHLESAQAKVETPVRETTDLDALQELTADELIAAIPSFDSAKRAEVLAWEQAHRNRVTVIRALEAGKVQTASPSAFS